MEHENAYRLLREQYLNKVKRLFDAHTNELVLRIVQEAEASAKGMSTQEHFTRDMFAAVLDMAEREGREEPDVFKALSLCGLEDAIPLSFDNLRYLETAMSEAKAEMAKRYYLNECNNAYIALTARKVEECMELIEATNEMELKNLAADTTGLGYIQDMFECSVSIHNLDDYATTEQAAFFVAMDLGLDLEDDVFPDERMTRGLNAAAETLGWPKGCIFAMRDAWQKQQAGTSTHA